MSTSVSGGRRRLLATLALALLAPRVALAQRKTAPYVPTPWPIVDAMLDLGAIRRDDMVMDLGCGDGRLVVTAAKRYGARGYGVDIDEELVALANRNASAAGVADRVRFERRDLFQTDLSEATVLTLYLLPQMVIELVPRILAQMPAGARVVSHDYPLSPWPPERHLSLDVPEKEPITGTTYTALYLYVVPARVGGVWRLDLPAPLAPGPARLVISQKMLRVEGTLTVGARTAEVNDLIVRGDTVRLLLPPLSRGASRLLLEGHVRGDTLEGTIESPRGPGKWRATRLAAEPR